ncbi:unnamed protein product [Protopolystoma xenopodis]|uniref:Uncharacterized protein n=1 Tax=Protopolystoma xenopodis TaxID=117903 RepID=A0A3S4ZBQ9_9PLAT|nr:unnamed protein product [Protopolystoma xenopodis]
MLKNAAAVPIAIESNCSYSKSGIYNSLGNVKITDCEGSVDTNIATSADYSIGRTSPNLPDCRRRNCLSWYSISAHSNSSAPGCRSPGSQSGGSCQSRIQHYTVSPDQSCTLMSLDEIINGSVRLIISIHLFAAH